METLSRMAREQLSGRALVYDTESGRMKSVPKPAPSTAGEPAKTCCGQDEFCPTCEPATFATQPAQGERKLLNLALTALLNSRPDTSNDGAEVRQEAITKLRAALLQSTPGQ